MSDRTAASLTQIDALILVFSAMPAGAARDELLDEAQALRRAIAAFHMEAIRFRMYSVDRLLKVDGTADQARPIFDALRHELETAGFHTRSHTAP